MKIVVAMSGGVDSSTAAALLVEAGHEVIGVAMKTHASTPRANRACCTPDDMRDARRVADLLDIPFYVLNYADLFAAEVIAPFADAYMAGRTPNPCVACNDKVKFRPLLARARLLGAACLATGHYARRHECGDGTVLLQRAVDRQKDQSYFLYRLDREQLREVRFPLGDMTKDSVRDHARRLGLPVADKSESQEICFVGAEGYARVVEDVARPSKAAGSIVDTSGRVLGEHDGVHHFTIGQRRGLKIAAPHPLYVVHIDASRRLVVVGTQEALLGQTVHLTQVVWHGPPPGPDEPFWMAQRYREAPRAVRVEALGHETARVRLDVAHGRGAPGQAAVIYDAAQCVRGGGVIEAPRRPRLPIVTSSEVRP